MSEWQPIETAPKDGRPFLIFSEGRNGVAFIDPRDHDGLKFNVTGAVIVGPDPYNGGRPGMAMSADYLSRATHWMPLPAPPQGLRERGG